MKKSTFKTLILTTSAFCISTVFANITISKYHLGAMTLSSGSYKFDDDEILGPIQAIPVTTSNGNFLLKPGEVINQSTSKKVEEISDPQEICQILNGIRYIAKKELKSETIEKSTQNNNNNQCNKAQAEDQIEEDLFELPKTKALLTDNKLLKQIFNQKDDCKIYILDDRNILVGTPVQEMKTKYPNLSLCLHPVFTKLQYFEQQLKKVPVIEQGSPEDLVTAQCELKEKIKDLEVEASHILQNANLGTDYDMEDVKKYLKSLYLHLTFQSHKKAFESLKAKTQDYYLISCSDSIAKLLKGISVDEINGPSSSQNTNHSQQGTNNTRKVQKKKK